MITQCEEEREKNGKIVFNQSINFIRKMTDFTMYLIIVKAEQEECK